MHLWPRCEPWPSPGLPPGPITLECDKELDPSIALEPSDIPPFVGGLPILLEKMDVSTVMFGGGGWKMEASLSPIPGGGYPIFDSLDVELAVNTLDSCNCNIYNKLCLLVTRWFFVHNYLNFNFLMKSLINLTHLTTKQISGPFYLFIIFTFK